MKRHVAARAKREQEVPRCFTKVLPEQMAGAALEQEAGESGRLVMSTTSLAACPRPKPDRGQPSRWAFHKKAMQYILVRIPGAFQKRGKNLPGIVSNPQRLAAKVLFWMRYGHVSLEAVAKAMGEELEAVSESIWVAATRRGGAAVRTLPGNRDKPLDVAGRYDARTLTWAIYAYHMACDGSRSFQQPMWCTPVWTSAPLGCITCKPSSCMGCPP